MNSDLFPNYLPREFYFIIIYILLFREDSTVIDYAKGNKKLGIPEQPIFEARQKFIFVGEFLFRETMTSELVIKEINEILFHKDGIDSLKLTTAANRVKEILISDHCKESEKGEKNGNFEKRCLEKGGESLGE